MLQSISTMLNQRSTKKGADHIEKCVFLGILCIKLCLFFFTVLMQQFSALHRFVFNSYNPLSRSNQYQSMSVISC